MYGKWFASAYTGSMFGAGSDLFAVWGYVIAHTVDSTVELNPAVLAATLGATQDRMREAINRLCSPDAESRNKANGGRRLVHEGGFQYHVTSHAHYRALRNDDERRAYNRQKQQESRARRHVKRLVNDSQRKSSVSAHTEAEAEAEKAFAGGAPAGPLVLPPAPPIESFGALLPAEEIPTSARAIEPKRARPKRKAPTPAGPDLPPGLSDAPEFRTAWAAWLADRAARRKTVTARAAKMQLAKLAAWGPAMAVASIKQSIEHGWAGLFAPQESSGNGHHGVGGKSRHYRPPEPRDDTAAVLASLGIDGREGEV